MSSWVFDKINTQYNCIHNIFNSQKLRRDINNTQYTLELIQSSWLSTGSDLNFFIWSYNKLDFFKFWNKLVSLVVENKKYRTLYLTLAHQFKYKIVSNYFDIGKHYMYICK